MGIGTEASRGTEAGAIARREQRDRHLSHN